MSILYQISGCSDRDPAYLRRRLKKAPLPRDLKQLTLAVIRGYETRKQRYSSTGLSFDEHLIRAVEQAMLTVGTDIADDRIRTELLRKVIDSLTEEIPYCYMGECWCGENKFYQYRRDFCREVAYNLGALKRPEKK